MENAKRTNDNFRLKWPTHRRREKKKTNTKAKTLLLHACFLVVSLLSKLNATKMHFVVVRALSY